MATCVRSSVKSKLSKKFSTMIRYPSTGKEIKKNIYKLYTFILYFAEVNECESHPCQNNGSCSDLVNKYSCQCITGYTGSNCEIGRIYIYYLLLARFVFA